MADRITVDRKRTLDTPIQRAGGDYTVTRRELSRVHFSDDGFTCYYQEGGAEVGEFQEWTQATKAAFLVFMDTPRTASTPTTPER